MVALYALLEARDGGVLAYPLRGQCPDLCLELERQPFVQESGSLESHSRRTLYRLLPRGAARGAPGGCGFGRGWGGAGWRATVTTRRVHGCGKGGGTWGCLDYKNGFNFSVV